MLLERPLKRSKVPTTGRWLLSNPPPMPGEWTENREQSFFENTGFFVFREGKHFEIGAFSKMPDFRFHRRKTFWERSFFENAGFSFSETETILPTELLESDDVMAKLSCDFLARDFVKHKSIFKFLRWSVWRDLESYKDIKRKSVWWNRWWWAICTNVAHMEDTIVIGEILLTVFML